VGKVIDGVDGLKGKRRAAPTVAGGDILRDESALGIIETLDRLRRGSFIACNRRYGSDVLFHVKIDRCMEF
jgi:hypothetical protein